MIDVIEDNAVLCKSDGGDERLGGEALSDHIGLDAPRDADPHTLVEMVLDKDLDRSLFGVGLLESWLSDQEMIGVFRARKQRKSWAWIGARLGRSRQAVWERWHDKSDEDPEK